MEFRIGKLRIEITWDDRPIWEKNAKAIAKAVDLEATKNYRAKEFGVLKIERIKNGWGFGLKDCKRMGRTILPRKRQWRSIQGGK